MREFMDIVKALADENRVRALLSLREGESCVRQIIELLNLAPSTLEGPCSFFGSELDCPSYLDVFSSHNPHVLLNPLIAVSFHSRSSTLFLEPCDQTSNKGNAKVNKYALCNFLHGDLYDASTETESGGSTVMKNHAYTLKRQLEKCC